MKKDKFIEICHSWFISGYDIKKFAEAIKDFSIKELENMIRSLKYPSFFSLELVDTAGTDKYRRLTKPALLLAEEAMKVKMNGLSTTKEGLFDLMKSEDFQSGNNRYVEEHVTEGVKKILHELTLQEMRQLLPFGTGENGIFDTRVVFGEEILKRVDKGEIDTEYLKSWLTAMISKENEGPLELYTMQLLIEKLAYLFTFDEAVSLIENPKADRDYAGKLFMIKAEEPKIEEGKKKK